VRTESPGTLERAYRDHGARIQRAVVLFTGSRQIAEDAVADAFALALDRPDAVRDPVAWVWKVAFRLAARELERVKRTGGEVPELAVPENPSLVDLTRALRRIAPKQRAAVVLHHYAGYSTREVARILGSTQGAVMVHLSEGRRRLRRLLEERG
jgi:RNA polymerase sigma-70 factor (ECF subfamily)